MILPVTPSGGKPALLDNGLDYLDRGLCVFPTRGKRPAVEEWKPFQTRRPDPGQLRNLLSAPGVDGLAAIMGPISGGLACRDFDLEDSYFRWAAAHRDLAKTLPTAETSRGFHVYFRGPEGFADLEDGEYRGDAGHYTVLPPSRHPDGSLYRWVVTLPDGPLPLIDPVATGLLPGTLTLPAGRGRHPTTQQPKQHIACVPQAAVDAISATLPDGPGQRNRRVFDLARRLKGIPGLDTSPAALKAVVAEWHRRAAPVITTKDFAETWSDFQTAWLAVKVPHGTTVRAAYDAARRVPQAPVDDNADLGVLAAMCRTLGAGGREFYLACRTVEELFGITRMTAWRWLEALRFYEIIWPVKAGTLKGRQATTWVYTGGDMSP